MGLNKLHRNPLLGKAIEKRGLIDIPDEDVVECEIETPQFYGSPDQFHLHKQRGTFYKSQMKFCPFTGIFLRYTGGDHEVSFATLQDFQEAIVKLL